MLWLCGHLAVTHFRAFVLSPTRNFLMTLLGLRLRLFSLLEVSRLCHPLVSLVLDRLNASDEIIQPTGLCASSSSTGRMRPREESIRATPCGRFHVWLYTSSEEDTLRDMHLGPTFFLVLPHRHITCDVRGSLNQARKIHHAPTLEGPI